MQCKNCGAVLFQKNGVFVCPYCKGTYLKEELVPIREINEVIVSKHIIPNEFVVKGGVLISYNGNKSEIIIPNGIISIGKNAFKNNVIIRKVTFSGTEKSIEDCAFEGCFNLLEICNYQNIENFGDRCFMCAGLKHIEIGVAVEKLGANCFAFMPNLEKVNYLPKKNLKLSKTFTGCPGLKTVEMDEFYFFPSFVRFLELRNNKGNKRYTYFDAFYNTPFYNSVKEEIKSLYKQGVCPECGGVIKKRLFHAKCLNCGIDYKN